MENTKEAWSRPCRRRISLNNTLSHLSGIRREPVDSVLDIRLNIVSLKIETRVCCNPSMLQSFNHANSRDSLAGSEVCMDKSRYDCWCRRYSKRGHSFEESESIWKVDFLSAIVDKIRESSYVDWCHAPNAKWRFIRQNSGMIKDRMGLRVGVI